MTDHRDSFDYIVIGGGSARCVLANRLSANPSNRVLLLEAGPPDRHIWVHIPVGYVKTMRNPKSDWCLKTEPNPGLNGRSIAFPRGRVLGGSRSINGLLYIRRQDAGSAERSGPVDCMSLNAFSPVLAPVD